MENIVSLLQRTQPFNLLPVEVLQTIAEEMELVRYSREQVIYRQEATAMKVVSVIAEGEMETFFYDSNQNKRLVMYLRRCDVYGGISVLLNRKKSLRTVIAKKDTVVYNLGATSFKNLCNQYEAFLHHFTAVFTQRMMQEEFAHFYKKPNAFEEDYLAADQLYSKKIESIELISNLIMDLS